jgi:hypothetical protein
VGQKQPEIVPQAGPKPIAEIHITAEINSAELRVMIRNMNPAQLWAAAGMLSLEAEASYVALREAQSPQLSRGN